MMASTRPLRVMNTIFCRNFSSCRITLDKKVSSAPEGTVLKGLNILKDAKDPVAKDESEYPEWLWTLLDEEANGKNNPRKALSIENNKKIKASNFLKSRKT
ncbi:hypothetical protein H4219_002386 [Mycoemilia scoparia]|uniref:Large ribosomal subunit protein mL54 n=1 Tax=Mycoemilia scoparia TaxID=417184 RepID=A0A9W8DQM0_9FUNG|nr:hypothetical protein H4219_002386 [Mycoemilia scoparia]